MASSGSPSFAFEESSSQSLRSTGRAPPGGGVMAPPMTRVGGPRGGGVGGGGGGLSVGPLTTEMQGIAKRIEGRCAEREKERTALAVAQAERGAVDAELQEVREAHQHSRIAFLERLRDAQGAELELHRWQVEHRRQRREEQLCAEQDARDGARLDEAMSSWHGELGMMAAAVVKREWYLLHLRGTIEAKQSAQRKRQRKKELLRRHNEALEARSIEAVRGADRAKEEIQRLEEEDSARKAHVQRVANEVRSQLAKRTELRRAHREAQQLLRTASSDA